VTGSPSEPEGERPGPARPSRIRQADLEAYRAADPKAFGRILHEVIRPHLLCLLRQLEPKRGQDHEDLVEGVLLRLWAWFVQPVRRNPLPASEPELLGYARATLRHVLVDGSRRRAPVEASDIDCDSRAAPELYDAWRWILDLVAAWSAAPPPEASQSLGAALPLLLEAIRSEDRLPRVQECAAGLGVSKSVAGRLRSELVELITRTARRELSL